MTYLEASEGTDHEDTSANASGAQVVDADLAGNLTKTLALVLCLAHLRHERICVVGKANGGECRVLHLGTVSSYTGRRDVWSS